MKERRTRARIYIAAFFLFFTALPSLLYAGMSLTYTQDLKKIDVLGCEELSVQNVGQVSKFTTTPRRNNWPDGTYTEWSSSDLQKFVSLTPGHVLKAVVQEQRVITQRLLESGRTEDSGWTKPSESGPQYFFVPKQNDPAQKFQCSDIENKTQLNITMDGKGGCDTVPPSGICAFDGVAHLADAQTWEKYGN